MATFIRASGESEILSPPNGVHWRLEELQTLVGDYIEVVGTTDGRYMVLDELGKLKHKPLNREATILYVHGRRDPIVGDVVIIDTKLEMDGPDEEEAS